MSTQASFFIIFKFNDIWNSQTYMWILEGRSSSTNSNLRSYFSSACCSIQVMNWSISTNIFSNPLAVTDPDSDPGVRESEWTQWIKPCKIPHFSLTERTYQAPKHLISRTDSSWQSRGQRFDPAYLHQKGLFSYENKLFHNLFDAFDISPLFCAPSGCTHFSHTGYVSAVNLQRSQNGTQNAPASLPDWQARGRKK